MYKVRIDQFEGPFDLLLYLLENARMDIYDIRVTEITEQYIGYLKEMDELNVEVGSEFIVLAAALIRLKSRMLLPRVTEVDEMIVEEDPRTELAERLTEYLQTKKIAEMLQRREKEYSGIYTKPAEDISEYLNSPEELLKTDPDKFVRTFRSFLEKKKRLAEVRNRYERIRRNRSSVEERIAAMASMLERKWKNQDSVSFSELLAPNADRYDRTLSFMSLLEMIKMQEVNATQDRVYGEIEITKRTKDQTNVQSKEIEVRTGVHDVRLGRTTVRQ